jgi:hypothetical protein
VIYLAILSVAEKSVMKSRNSDVFLEVTVAVQGLQHGQYREAVEIFEITLSENMSLAVRVRPLLESLGWSIRACQISDVVIKSSCFGCRNGKCDQKSHEQKGGCLYNSPGSSQSQSSSL